jgi:MFS family permease
VATLSFGAAPAAAAQPCWQRLFVDWADGRIDKTYPVHCYREAIKHLQEDTLIYGSASQDINRALMAAMTKMRKDGKHITPASLVPPGPGASSGGGPGSKHDEGFFDRLVHAIGPTSADSVPLPLLILAGLAMLLLAAAANLAELLGAALLFALAMGLVQPPALAWGIDLAAERRATAMATMIMAQDLGLTVGGTVLGIVGTLGGYGALFLAAAVPGAAALMGLLIAWRTGRVQPRRPAP